MKPEELERQFAAGESIVEPGSADRLLYVVRSGDVRIESAGGTRRIGRGDVFGELPALLGQASEERAVAESDATVLALEPAVLERLCTEGGEFAVRFVLHLAARLARSRAERSFVADMGQPDPDLAALARVLLAARTTSDEPSPVEGTLRDLAARAGLSIRRAYHGVQVLLERRVLRLVDDQLSVIEPDALEALARR